MQAQDARFPYLNSSASPYPHYCVVTVVPVVPVVKYEELWSGGQ